MDYKLLTQRYCMGYNFDYETLQDALNAFDEFVQRDDYWVDGVSVDGRMVIDHGIGELIIDRSCVLGDDSAVLNDWIERYQEDGCYDISFKEQDNG